jgi:hypothetical protein
LTGIIFSGMGILVGYILGNKRLATMSDYPQIGTFSSSTCGGRSGKSGACGVLVCSCRVRRE